MAVIIASTKEEYKIMMSNIFNVPYEELPDDIRLSDEEIEVALKSAE